MNNAVYLNYLEFARMEFMKTLGLSLDELRQNGFALVIARICIDYKREARQDDILQIITKPVKKGKISGIFGQRIYRDSELIAEAEVTYVCIDKNGKPVRFPAELKIEELES